MNEQNSIVKIAAIPSIGELLAATNRLTIEQAEAVLAVQAEEGIRFGEAAIRLGYANDEDIQRALAHQFAYAYLKDGDNVLSDKLIAAYHPFAREVEQLRSLRSQIKTRWIGQGNRAFAITGYEEHAGSSYVASNLAVVFSHLGERTLLVDANLRNPCQHEIFKLSNRQGLTDILVGRADICCAQPIDKLLGLTVLTAGTAAPNPQELLSRPVFGWLLAEVSREFDVVILDSPPLALCADAQIVSGAVGGLLVVANCHKTRMAGLKRELDELYRLGIQIIGCVLNEAK